MTFTINAWLDKPIPELSIIQRGTGKTVAFWRGDALNNLFSGGVISYDELNQASEKSLKRMVKRLILEYATEQMKNFGIQSPEAKV